MSSILIGGKSLFFYKSWTKEWQNACDPDVIRTRSLLIWSQTRYHCATKANLHSEPSWGKTPDIVYNLKTSYIARFSHGNYTLEKVSKKTDDDSQLLMGFTFPLYSTGKNLTSDPDVI